MKIKSVLLGSVALATALNAQNLIQDALDAGLVAIPSDPKALTKAKLLLMLRNIRPLWLLTSLVRGFILIRDYQNLALLASTPVTTWA